jgi:ribosomal protein S18 acetylase RimI-like enzyme
MKIRPAKVADVPVLVALNQSMQQMHAESLPERFRRDAPPEVVERAFAAMIQAPTSFWLVAEDQKDRPMAFLSAEFREREENWFQAAHRVCYLAGIFVASAFRRQGIARALLAELKREAAARSVKNIDLDVWAFNEPARQTFARLGFRGVMERMTSPVEE